MTVQLLKIKGTRYVLIKEADYRRIQKQLQQERQDRGDIAQVRRAKASGPSMPYSEFRKKMGLK